MATKHFCDGCDREKVPELLTRVTVGCGAGAVSQVSYDLCEACKSYFSGLLPSKWARSEPPKAA